MERWRKFFRYSAAAIFMAASFLGLPLAFCRFSGEAVPCYGLVNLFTLPSLCLLALGIIAAFPEELYGVFRDPKFKFLQIGAGAFLLGNIIQLILGNITAENFLGAGFYIAAPLAAAALKTELRKLLIPFAALGTLILLCSGLTSEGFTGLTGNWNWTSGIFIALLPGIFMLISPRRYQWFFPAAGGMFFLLFYCIDPVRFPRGALLAMLGAWILLQLRKRLPEKKFVTLLTAAGIIGGILLTVTLLLISLPDTRWQMWRGAVNLGLGNLFTGAGAGHFPEVIHRFLPESYFFTEFPAPNIDHAHNDLLHLLGEYGLAGIFFYFTGIIAVLRRKPHTPQAFLAYWMAAVMLICGFFDQHNISVMGGMVLALAAGLNLAPYNSCRREIPCRWKISGAAAGAVLFISGIFMIQREFRASVFLRQGDLAALKNDIPAAVENYERSMKIKFLPMAAYQYAEMKLLFYRQSAEALTVLKNMENRLTLHNFRHQQRLTGWAHFDRGDFSGAVKYFSEERRRAPYSVINANFYRIALRQSGAEKSEIIEADRNFLELCRLRGIAPQDLPHFTVRDDDVGFKPEVRANYFQKNGKTDPVFRGIFRNISGALLLMLAVYGTGCALLKPFGKSDAVTAAALGMVVSGMAALVIPPAIHFYLLFIPAAYGGFSAYHALRSHWRTALIFTLLLLPFFAAMLLPPAAWDEQVYQLSLLKRYLALNSTAVQLDNPYSAYPSLGQLWLLPGCVPGNFNVPSLTVWALTVLMAWKFYHAGKPYGKVLAGITLAAVICTPLFWNIIRSFYVETAVVFFGFAGMILLSGSWRSPRWQYFFAGIAAGAAAAVKLPGAVVSLMLFIWLISDHARRRYLGFFILGAITAALPFFLRVWICCGNPLYPYFSSFLGGSESAVLVEKFHLTLGSNYGTGKFSGIITNLIRPLIMEQDYDGIAPGFQQVIIVLIICAAAVKNKFRYNWLLRGTLTLLAGWIFWNLSAQQSRFLYPLLWAGAFFALYALSVFPAKVRQLAGLLLILCAGLNLWSKPAEWQHFFLAPRSLKDACKSPAHFASWLHEEPVYMEIVKAVESIAPAPVALLWERRTLYLPENVTVIMPGFQEKLTPAPANAAELYRELRPFAYIVVRPPLRDVDKGIEFAPDAVRINSMLMELLTAGKLTVHTVTSDGQIAILRIVPETLPTAERASS